MPQYPIAISDREKEFKTLKSRIPKNLEFDGITDTSRKHFLKFSKKMTNTFELSKETNIDKSGGWNYEQLLKPNSQDVWRDHPFDEKPDSTDVKETKLYDRIEAMNAVGKLIMDDMITQDAAEIFDTGYYDDCPDKHSYMNLQYGMRALYIKYCAKTVNLAFELRLQLRVKDGISFYIGFSCFSNYIFI